MIWVPIGAWIAAAVIAVVVLGYCAYQIVWRLRRLQHDVAGLSGAAAELAQLRAGLTEAQQRVAALELS